VSAPPHVLVVGDVMTDVLVRVDAPLAVGSDTAAQIVTRGGGSGANTACWLAALGVPVTYVGRVGDDPFGPEAVELLRTAGVRPSVAVDATAATGTCVVLVDADGERTMLPDAGANSMLTPADLPDELLRTAAHLHLSAYTLLNPGSRAAGRHAIRRARSLGLTVSVDAASAAPIDAVGARRVRELISGADLLLCNQAEGFALVDAPDPARAGALLTRTVQEVVVKVGEGGAWWVRRGATQSPVHVPAVRVPAVHPPAGPGEALDTTGAGDAFAAGFLAAWLLDAAPDAALRSGCASAARAVALPGGRPPHPSSRRSR